MNDPIRRTDTVKIKLAPEILARLEEQARAYGFPPSTMCAYAVADWLQRQEANAQLARTAVMHATRNMGITEEQIGAALEHSLPAMMKALNQLQPPLDGEASPGDAKS